MKQLTLRGFEPELLARVKLYAEQEGLSLNRAVLRLLREATGLAQDSRDEIGDTLDHLAGTWTEEEEKEFLAAVDEFDQIDPELWE